MSYNPIIDYSVNLLKRRRLHGGSDTITFCKFWKKYEHDY